MTAEGHLPVARATAEGVSPSFLKRVPGSTSAHPPPGTPSLRPSPRGGRLPPGKPPPPITTALRQLLLRGPTSRVKRGQMVNSSKTATHTGYKPLGVGHLSARSSAVQGAECGLWAQIWTGLLTGSGNSDKLLSASNTPTITWPYHTQASPWVVY